MGSNRENGGWYPATNQAFGAATTYETLLSLPARDFGIPFLNHWPLIRHQTKKATWPESYTGYGSCSLHLGCPGYRQEEKKRPLAESGLEALLLHIM
jgi:hypothetical protein